MKELIFILICMPTFLLGQKIGYKTITLEPHMYTQNYEHFKRLVLDSPDSEAEYIDGFDFEWGYYYTLKVKEKKVGPLSDGTRYDYSLLKVISKEKVSDTVIFRMFIDPLRYYSILTENGISNYTLSQLNDSTYLYMDKVEIEIPQKLQEFFIKKIDNEVGFRGSFKFVNGRRIRLVSYR
jgi:hypothetical protein